MSAVAVRTKDSNGEMASDVAEKTPILSQLRYLAGEDCQLFSL